MRRSSSSFSSSSIAASARSIRVRTSPMPRIRDAIRSGWNQSSASSFSPAEASLIGRPVTARTERAELDELVDRRGPLQVGGDEGGLPSLLLEQERELAGDGRLARALQAREQDRRRRPRREREARVRRTQELGQLLVHDLDDLLAGREALPHVLAERALADVGDELLDDTEVDVRLEQG